MHTFNSKKFLIALAAFALAALALIAMPVSHANAQTGGQGKIEGQIVNGTQGANPSSTANLTVTLFTFNMGASNFVSTTTQSDAGGKFAFSNLPIITTTQFFISAKYSDVDYFSDVLAFTSPDSTTLPAEIRVYESTTDPSVVKVTQMHLIVTPETPWFTIQQIIAFENSSDRVYIGKQLAGPHRATLTLPLLPQAINIEFDDPNVGQTVLEGDGVLTYTLPIGPGRDQVVMQYAVPFTPPTYDFNFKLPYDLGRFRIFMVDVGATIQSAQLTSFPAPMSGVQGAPKFIAVTGENFAAGNTVKATFNNLPATAGMTSSIPTDSTQMVGLIALGFAAVAAIGLLAFPLLRRRQAARIVAEEMKNERMDLLQDIADLDDDFEGGKITEEEYKHARAELKAKLLELGK